ncbi:MAG TPA: SRPBCC family protein [Chitinophagaceae bacterium]|jgi:uncharacterized protein YndB with AHSA1/START domain|nr:SRPBCC family protein [Chitinophagaceae bacterium]
MPTNVSRLKINTPLQRVWDVLTDPAHVKQWQYGSILTTDWKPGSPIRFRTEWDGKVFEQWGTILEVIPNELIKYSLFAARPGLEDKPENYFSMSYILKEEDGHVILEIHQQDDRPGAKQAEVQGEENPVLAGLKTLCES